MPSFGEKLKLERERRNTTLEEIAGTTKIQLSYLEALEHNEFDALPGLAFGKFYIRAYAEVLGFDPQPLIADYDRERLSRKRKAPRKARPPAPPRVRRVRFSVARPSKPVESEPATPAEAAESEELESARPAEAEPLKPAVEAPVPEPERLEVESAGTAEVEAVEREVGSAAPGEAQTLRPLDVELAASAEPEPAELDEGRSVAPAEVGSAAAAEVRAAEASQLPEPTQVRSVDSVEVAEAGSTAESAVHQRPEPAEVQPPGTAEAWPAASVLAESGFDATRSDLHAVHGPRRSAVTAGLLAMAVLTVSALAYVAFFRTGSAEDRPGTPTLAEETSAATSGRSASPAPSPDRDTSQATPSEAGGPRAAPGIAAPGTTTSSHLTVAEAGVGTAVVDRRLQGRGDRFEEGRVVVFATRVLGATPGEHVRHVWLHEGEPVQSVELELGGPHWRTHSRKTLWGLGRWTVEARDPEGRLLARTTFTCVSAGT